MNLSTKALNRLNGLKPGEEKLVEFRQPYSTTKTIQLDLAEVLRCSKYFEEFKAGDDCLIKNVHADGDALVVVISKGAVEKESTEVFAAALQNLIEDSTEE